MFLLCLLVAGQVLLNLLGAVLQFRKLLRGRLRLLRQLLCLSSGLFARAFLLLKECLSLLQGMQGGQRFIESLPACLGGFLNRERDKKFFLEVRCGVRWSFSVGAQVAE